MKRLITTTILALVLLALNASPATAGASVRQRLSADPGVDSIYTIDDNFSMVSSKNGVVENKDFKVVKDFSRDGERYQIIRHREAEPFAYRGGAAPGYNSTEMLADGKFDMKENGYGAADLYEHVRAPVRLVHKGRRYPLVRNTRKIRSVQEAYPGSSR